MAAGFEGMGIGQLGQPDKIFKRKFRYTFTIDTPCGPIPEWFVKTASRPQLDIEETELNFLNGVTWIPGKGKWQPLSVTYVDVSDQLQQPLYNWLVAVYDFIHPELLHQTEKPGWNGTGTLRMFDGCGNLIETWIMRSMWPQSINFGDLDYANSEEATIELSLRYSEVEWIPDCKMATPTCGCTGCPLPLPAGGLPTTV